MSFLSPPTLPLSLSPTPSLQFPPSHSILLFFLPFPSEEEVCERRNKWDRERERERERVKERKKRCFKLNFFLFLLLISLSLFFSVSFPPPRTSESWTVCVSQAKSFCSLFRNPRFCSLDQEMKRMKKRGERERERERAGSKENVQIIPYKKYVSYFPFPHPLPSPFPPFPPCFRLSYFYLSLSPFSPSQFPNPLTFSFTFLVFLTQFVFDLNPQQQKNIFL